MKASRDRFVPARLLHMVGVLAAAAALTGCVVAPLPGVAYGEPDYGYATSSVYGPAPYYAAQPAVPYVGSIWINGHWRGGGDRHRGFQGQHARPRPGHRGSSHSVARPPQREPRWQGRGRTP